MTQKLFQTNMYLKEAEAQVVSVNEADIVLDRTIFAPEAGGQPCDFGSIAGYNVIGISEKDGVIIHKIELPEGAELSLKAGDKAELRLDWARRFDHMQNHLGEHILSGLFKSRYDLDNKGFHLSDDTGAFDIDAKEITEEMIDEIERLANEVVYSALPVEISLIENAEEAAKLPLRKELKVGEDITVITVPGVDCVACCCPHPSNTSQIGLIKIIRTEKYKSMTRIYYKCGRRAFLDYQQKHRVVSVLNEKYSADEFSLLGKMKIADDKNEVVRKELNKTKDSLAKIRADELLKNADKMVVGEFERADIDELKRVAKKIIADTHLPVVLSSASDLCVFMTHSGKSGLKCGSMVKEFAAGAGGKGGGSDTQAQVIFNNIDLMRNFIKIAKSSLNFTDS